MTVHAQLGRHCRARRRRVNALGSATERWPEILPHYRYVRVLQEHEQTRVVGDGRVAGRLPDRWVAEQTSDPVTPHIRFSPSARVDARDGRPSGSSSPSTAGRGYDRTSPAIRVSAGGRVVGPESGLRIFHPRRSVAKTLARVKADRRGRRVNGRRGAPPRRGDRDRRGDARWGPGSRRSGTGCYRNASPSVRSPASMRAVTARASPPDRRFRAARFRRGANGCTGPTLLTALDRRGGAWRWRTRTIIPTARRATSACTWARRLGGLAFADDQHERLFVSGGSRR